MLKDENWDLVRLEDVIIGVGATSTAVVKFWILRKRMGLKQSVRCEM